MTINLNIKVYSQVTYYQDIFNGEVCYVGFSSGDGSGQINLPTNLAPNTLPKKIFLICYANKGNYYVPNFKKFSIDGKQFSFDTIPKSSFFIGNNTIIPVGSDYNGHVTYILDLTAYITEINSTISVNWFEDSFPPPLNCPSCLVSSPVLLILKEDIDLPTISISLCINDKNNDNDIFLSFENLNPSFLSSQIALGIQTDRLGWANEDGYVFKLNQQDLGIINTSDPDEFNLFSGAMGCFKYGNNAINGLTGDTPDSIFSGDNPIIHNADGLADISSYVINDNTTIDLSVSYLGNSLSQHNIFVSSLLAYTTPCQPQNVTVSPDTTICPNTFLQLSATGGTSTGTLPQYEWLPQKDLSCYNCPNPVFSGDSSQLYTVRIRSSDSCSVVRPVMIHVRTKPKTVSFSQNSTFCADSTGIVNWQTLGANTYSIDNGAFQSSGFFSQLSGGAHLLTVKDAFGCTYDTLVNIISAQTVNAILSATPTSGSAPLEVQISNQSTNATDFSWSVNNEPQPNTSINFVAYSAGVYTIELIAWQNDPTCADTAFQTITVSENGFYILGSSLVMASSNTQNAFMVFTNGTPIIDIALYDAQGRLLKKKENVQLSAGSNAIWSNTEMSEIAAEMVFYRLSWQTGSGSGEVNGKVLVLQ